MKGSESTLWVCISRIDGLFSSRHAGFRGEERTEKDRERERERERARARERVRESQRETEKEIDGGHRRGAEARSRLQAQLRLKC